MTVRLTGKLPDFLIIGAQKGGTTSLFNYLMQHPDVASPTTREIHYFDANYARGEEWYRSFFPPLAQGGLSAAPGVASRMTGESTPYYLFHPRVPERASRLFPRVKLLLLLRNPVDRAYSHYQMMVLKGREELSFEDAIEREPDRLRGEEERLLADGGYVSLAHRRHSYVARGLYADQIARWAQHFPGEQMLILKAEDLFAEPVAIFREVSEFLGLSPWQLDDHEAYHSGAYAEMRPATRLRLLDYFAPHNRRLYDALGRDLGWG